jgi:hypothetical protein
MPMGVSDCVSPGPTAGCGELGEYPSAVPDKAGTTGLWTAGGLPLREEGGVRKAEVPRTPPLELLLSNQIPLMIRKNTHKVCHSA